MRILVAALMITGLAGCAKRPVPPDWQLDARNALEAAVGAYLEGNDRIADVEMARARRALGATARPDLLARAELVRCAAQVASLVLAPCAAFDALAVDAAPAERAYAAYLRGAPADPALLPAQHRGVGTGQRLTASEDPLARLIAAGVLLQRQSLSDAELTAAVDTSSAQGWRRPLLAWLGEQQRRARAAGDDAEAQRVQRRIDLVR
ncbi:hypothetical protein RD110_01685 [Rhodoferax koreense]|uniref:Lipoprotein n=1 Tax=Rhodoferax koreensis TaxID=1842727 RepID=A0A1P8JQR8_9BURK|nr:hypothetical protein [Rhodoferax koreense]APW36075.1 hypothetical protein RD110_01685 [Rhodoferax koreense]